MTMAPRLMERRELPNGLTLEFWDESRRVAGGRWYVGVRAVVPVSLSDHQVDHIAPEVVEVIRSEVGEHLCFQLREEKNFVAEAEVDALREEFKRVFLNKTPALPVPPRFPLPLRGRQAQGGGRQDETGKRVRGQVPGWSATTGPRSMSGSAP